MGLHDAVGRREGQERVKSFAEMCDDVFHWESGLEAGAPGTIGVFSWTQGDHGGPTRWGITQATYTAWRAERGLPPATPDDVRNMPEADAVSIYNVLFCHGPHFDELPDGIREEVFDIGVGSGPRKAAELLQQTLTDVGYPCAVDGQIGPATVAAAVAADQALGDDGLLNRLIDEREGWYAEIERRDPSQLKFARGWQKRAEELRPRAPT